MYLRLRSLTTFFTLLLSLALIFSTLTPTLPTALAQDTAKSVILVGSLATALGCADKDVACDKAKLTYDQEDDLWVAIFNVPAGSYEYMAVVDGAASQSFGLADGSPVKLTLNEARNVKVFFDAKTGYVRDNVTTILANVPGSYQDTIGCPNEWAPDCLRSLLEDPEGDGVYTFVTKAIPAGDYEAKVAINEAWSENYGSNGARDGANISFNVPANGVGVTFTWDSKTKIMDIIIEGAPQGSLKRAQAHWVTRDTILWPSTRFTPDSKFTLHAAPKAGMKLEMSGLTGAESTFELTVNQAGISDELKAHFPHLSNATVLTLPPQALRLVNILLKGQLAITASNAEGKIVDATGLQIPGVLDDTYRYEGTLGVTVKDGVPTLSVWAPTAQKVRLLLFDDAKMATESTPQDMSFDQASGVWSLTGQADWLNKFYLYEVTVYAPTTNKIEVNQVTDPYSFSLSTDSLRSQIIDLSATNLMPEGWATLGKPTLNAPEDIIIYELHIRDFSIKDQSVPENYRGKFMAFTVKDSAGMRHLAALAQAGLTHIHLLPSFDFATVRENVKDQQEAPLKRLQDAASDSDKQQAIVTTFKSRDGFNWGYDPYHYNVPEGSYATDPNGSLRVLEFRNMVKALNETGLNVVMDVVYNHTTASGQNQRSVLDRIVPGYYHRLSGDGGVEQSTCCANTATEHAMMQKLMVDSVVMWATQYKVDGFRFDLMGHHMKADMLKVRQALDALTVEKDGVDGKRIYVYGEGWDFGEVSKNQRGVNATQLNMAGTGIGTFNDRLRDAVRGGGPFSDILEQGFATGLLTSPNGKFKMDDEQGTLLHITNWIQLGLAGNLADYVLVAPDGSNLTGKGLDYKGAPAGYTADPQENIVYVAAHDNETLFDIVQLKLPADAPLATRIRAHNLALSVAAFAQGVPFFHAGDDLLRSKSMDRDSYDSGDWYNAIDWTGQDNGWGHGLPLADKNKDKWPIMQPLLANAALKPSAEDSAFAQANFLDLLRIRKSSPLFRLQTAEQVIADVSFLNTGAEQTPGVIVYVIEDKGNLDPNYQKIVVVFNGTNASVTIQDASLQNLKLHPVQAEGADTVVKTATATAGSVSVPAWTTAVFVVND